MAKVTAQDIEAYLVWSDGRKDRHTWGGEHTFHLTNMTELTETVFVVDDADGWKEGEPLLLKQSGPTRCIREDMAKAAAANREQTNAVIRRGLGMS